MRRSHHDHRSLRGTTVSVVVGTFAATTLLAVTIQPSLSDGVYSDRQASRGRRVYRQACVSCHESNLEGGEMGPALLGDPFLEPWDGESLGELMVLLRQTMPQDNPGGLSEEDYADVIAYLLQVNEYPSGESELNAESLEAIVIESPG